MPAPNFPSSNHRAQFIAARDSRNRRVPGLYRVPAITPSFGSMWKRRENIAPFFAQGQRQSGGPTLSAAREALEIKRHERRENQLPTIGHKPLFRDYCAIYFEKAKVQRKRRHTVAGEREAVARWCDHLGHVRVDQIAIPLITSYIDRRSEGRNFRAASWRRSPSAAPIST